jgi:hypothetical protein
MLIVTTPSPGLRAAREISLACGLLAQFDIGDRDLEKLEQQEPFASLGFTFSKEDRDYDKTAKSLNEMELGFFEAYDLEGIGTQRVVFELSSPENITADDRFRNLLGSELGKGIVDQLTVYQEQPTHAALFDVRGPADVLNRVHQIRLTEDVLHAAFGPECGLVSVRVEGIHRNNSWEVSSPASPVRATDIIRAALTP